MDRRAGRAPEVAEVQTFVLPVRVADRILEPKKESRYPGKGLRQGLHERDRAAAADLDGVAPVALAERSPRSVECRSLRVRAPARGERLHLGLDLDAPGGVLLQKLQEAISRALGILSGGKPDADARTAIRV